MSPTTMSSDDPASRVLRSKKYRKVDLDEVTVRAVVADERTRHRDPKRALDAAKRKLHHIAAAYLGDPDYDAAERELRTAAASSERDRLLDVCARVASAHATTRERLAIVGRYYAEIFAVTGRPAVLLDLACGLNPVLLPWMDLPPGARYHAYDIRTRRVAFLNSCFEIFGYAPLAEVRDVVVSPPTIEGDVALLLQEAHRLEQRRAGATRTLLQQLRTRHIVLSLPGRGLSGRNDLTLAHRTLFARIIDGLPWRVTPLTIGNELAFCIDKTPRE